MPNIQSDQSNVFGRIYLITNQVNKKKYDGIGTNMMLLMEINLRYLQLFGSMASKISKSMRLDKLKI